MASFPYETTPLDERVSFQNCLFDGIEQVSSLPKLNGERWIYFSAGMKYFKNYFDLSKAEAIAKGFAPDHIPPDFQSTLKKLLRTIVESDDEPILFRSHAKFYRIYYDDDESFINPLMEDSDGNRFAEYYEDVVDMCDSLTSKERKVVLSLDNTNQFKVGTLMDDLKKTVKSAAMQRKYLVAVRNGSDIIYCLQEVPSLPKMSTKRWLYFLAAMNFFRTHFALSQEDVELRGIAMIRPDFLSTLRRILRTLLEDKGEPVLYHCYAKFYSLIYDDVFTSTKDLNDYLVSIKSTCELVTLEERKMVFDRDYVGIETITGDEFYVGSLLDELKKMISDQMKVTSEMFISSRMRLVLALPPSDKRRFAIFAKCLIDIRSKKIRPVPKEVFAILKKIYQNKKEPALFSAHAAGYLCLHDKNNLLDLKAQVECLKETIRLCDSAKASERRRNVIVKMDENGNERSLQVGTLLDNLKKDTNKYLGDLPVPTKNQHNFQYCERVIDEMCKRDGSRNKNELTELFTLACEGGNLKDGYFTRTPEITSAVIDKIKSLPEKDTAVYLFRDNNAIDTLKKMDSDEMNTQMKSFIDDSIFICAVEVNMKRFNSGARKKLFKRIGTTASSDSVQKVILGTFVKMCMSPYDIFGLRKSNIASFRPRTVFLEDNDDANQPQVKAFLNMMGCSEVSKIDPIIAILAEEQREDYKKTDRVVPKGCSDFPFTRAMEKNLVCFGCGKVDPNAMQCPCRKIYFCNKECQKMHWSKHKKDHKRFMKKQQKKNII